MKIARNSVFYFTTIGVFIISIWLILEKGETLEKQPVSFPIDGVVSNPPVSDSQGIWSELSSNILLSLHHPFSILLLQILIIILTSRIFAFLFQKIKQPSVIGEVLAGILLGPSFLGLFFPEVFSFIFPANSLNNLQFLSQIGLILFMFIIGMELDLKLLKNTAGTAVLVSHASIIFPYLLGVILSLFLFVDYAPDNIGFLPFALFMGIAMSITAFPILARILQERGLTKTPLGVMSLTCGAIDDVTAWAALAAVIAIVKSGSLIGAVSTIGLTAIYLIVMLYLVQPFLMRVGKIYISRETINKTLIALIFALLLISSYITETIGIHALFGAFVAGLIMPHNLEFKKNLVEKIEDISLVLFLPLFFAFTGLRTQINLLNEPKLWEVFFWVLAVAILGKFGGSALSARFGGLSWKISLSLGALMNTRGLIQLVVLNIGYELGILSPQIFAILVLMALITTFMTTPSLQLIEYIYRKKAIAVAEKILQPFRILISFGPPAMGSTLLKIAQQISPPNPGLELSQYSAIHLTPSSEVHPAQALIFEEEGFAPIRRTAEQNGLNISTIYKATDDVQNEILRTANREAYDFLLLGSARSVFSGNYLGGKIRHMLSDCRCNIGIFVNKQYVESGRVVMLIPGTTDAFSLRLINNFINRVETQSLCLVNSKDTGLPPEIPTELAHESTQKISLKPYSALLDELNPEQQTDLLVIKVEEWKELYASKNHLPDYLPSVLILKIKN
jgi:Kef-type K+ transport system membrane component KefB